MCQFLSYKCVKLRQAQVFVMSEVVGLNPDLIVCSRVAFSSAATPLASHV